MSRLVEAKWPNHLAAGLGHTLAISEGGEVFAWGQGTNGQLGFDTTKVRSAVV